jgi:hypothetical protein
MQGSGRQECARAKHSEGRERPHFGRPPAAQKFGGVAPGLSPQSGDRVLPACRNRRMQDVRQNVRQSRRGGREEQHGNHQGTA